MTHKFTISVETDELSPELQFKFKNQFEFWLELQLSNVQEHQDNFIGKHINKTTVEPQ